MKSVTTNQKTSEYWEMEAIKKNVLTFYNPISYQGYSIYLNDGHGASYKYVHNDYDGAPDAHDHRCGFGNTIDDCITQINTYILEND